MTAGTPIAVVGTGGEDIAQLLADVEAETRRAQEDRPAGAVVPAPAPASPPPGGKPLATPLAKRLARERGVDLSLVPPGGPGGRITERDILRYVEQVQAAGQGAGGLLEERPAAPSPTREDGEAAEVIPLAGVRKVIADNVVASVRTSPRYTLGIEIDCSALVGLRTTLREAFQRRHGIDLTYVPFMVKAMAKAVLDVPIVNAMVRNDSIVVQKRAHVGVAVASGDLIFVPVIRNALDKTVPEIAQELQDHVNLARQEKLTLEHLTGGTITLTNMGVTDVDVRPGIAVIHQPQVAIVVMGRVKDRVVARNGEAVVRPIMEVTFTYDHRVVMGVPGGRYAERVKHYLEHPEGLVRAEEGGHEDA
jgi:pyruvate/2-oxoglutarate dehydrogenase complex dihydrolipoamide acyltransferase (E2) component